MLRSYARILTTENKLQLFGYYELVNNSENIISISYLSWTCPKVFRNSDDFSLDAFSIILQRDNPQDIHKVEIS